MAEKRYFHLSDVLSLMTGMTVGNMKEMITPDKILRVGGCIEGAVTLCEFVSGVNLRVPDSITRFDGERFLGARDHAMESLCLQYPFLREVRFPEEDMPKEEEGASEQEVIDFCENFVRDVAQTYRCGEWLEIEQMPCAMANELNSDGLYVPTPVQKITLS